MSNNFNNHQNLYADQTPYQKTLNYITKLSNGDYGSQDDPYNMPGPSTMSNSNNVNDPNYSHAHPTTQIKKEYISPAQIQNNQHQGQGQASQGPLSRPHSSLSGPMAPPNYYQVSTAGSNHEIDVINGNSDNEEFWRGPYGNFYQQNQMHGPSMTLEYQSSGNVGVEKNENSHQAVSVSQTNPVSRQINNQARGASQVTSTIAYAITSKKSSGNQLVNQDQTSKNTQNTQNANGPQTSPKLKIEKFDIMEVLTQRKDTDKVLLDKLGKLLGTTLTTSRIANNQKNDGNETGNATAASKVSKAGLLSLAAQKIKDLEKKREEQISKLGQLTRIRDEIKQKIEMNSNMGGQDAGLKNQQNQEPRSATNQAQTPINMDSSIKSTNRSIDSNSDTSGFRSMTISYETSNDAASSSKSPITTTGAASGTQSANSTNQSPTTHLSKLQRYMKQKYKSDIQKDWKYYLFINLIMKNQLNAFSKSLVNQPEENWPKAIEKWSKEFLTAPMLNKFAMQEVMHLQTREGKVDGEKVNELQQVVNEDLLLEKLFTSEE